MNQATFFMHFEMLAGAPNAVAKLRELILQLAVQGKLVPQDARDEPASVMVTGTIGSRGASSGEGMGRPWQPLPLEEVPFAVPEGWLWLPLETVACKITDGEHLSPKKASAGVPLLTAKHVTDRGVTFDNPQFVSVEDAAVFRDRCDPRRGDILVCSRGTIGRCTVVRTDDLFCLMGSVILVRPGSHVDSEYLSIILSTRWAQQLMQGMSGATAVRALYLKDIRLCPIPLPPLPEQHRIVAKVDELMRLCDELEQRVQRQRRPRGKQATRSRTSICSRPRNRRGPSATPSRQPGRK